MRVRRSDANPLHHSDRAATPSSIQASPAPLFISFNAFSVLLRPSLWFTALYVLAAFCYCCCCDPAAFMMSKQTSAMWRWISGKVVTPNPGAHKEHEVQTFFFPGAQALWRELTFLRPASPLVWAVDPGSSVNCYFHTLQNKHEHKVTKGAIKKKKKTTSFNFLVCDSGWESPNLLIWEVLLCACMRMYRLSVCVFLCIACAGVFVSGFTLK